MLDVLSWLNSTFYDGLPYAIVTLSFVVTYKYLRFPDVTSAGTFVLGAATAAICVINFGLSPYIGIAIAVIAGMLGGGLTGFLYSVLKIDTLLAGILSAFSLYTINLMLLRPTLPYGTALTVLSGFEYLDREVIWANIGWHPFVIGYFLIIVVCIKLVLDRFFASEMGLMIRALEDEVAGESALRRQGISPGAYKTLGLAIGNGLVALAGALVSMKEGAANAHRGFDILITALIAFLIGTQVYRLQRVVIVRFRAAFSPGRLKQASGRFKPKPTTSAILGALVYFGLIALAQRISISAELTKLLLAIYVAVAVGDFGRIKSFFAHRLWRHIPDESKIAKGASSKSAVSLVDISYRYPFGDSAVVSSVNFEVQRGELVILEGGNGSGKTTLLRLIAGMIPTPDAGKILFEGEDISRNDTMRIKTIGYVDQNPHRGVVDTLSVEENLILASIGNKARFWRSALTTERRRTVCDLFSNSEFPNDFLYQEAKNLSGGQRQVVNILTLLGRKRPAIAVLLDEPLNNLDPANAERCRTIIKKIHMEGTAVILVSHSGKAEFLANRVVRLADGKLET